MGNVFSDKLLWSSFSEPITELLEALTAQLSSSCHSESPTEVSKLHSSHLFCLTGFHSLSFLQSWSNFQGSIGIKKRNLKEKKERSCGTDTQPETLTKLHRIRHPGGPSVHRSKDSGKNRQITCKKLFLMIGI